MMVYILLGTGFEEIEAVAPCDLLRRAGIETKLVGVSGPTVVGSHGVAVEADLTLGEVDFDAMELLMLPGGLRGVASLRASTEALALTRRAYDAGKYVAAICAAPTILAQLSITDGKRATCYPGKEPEMGGAICVDAPAVTDGKVLTGRSAGASFDFALALITALKDEAAAQKVASGVVYPAR